MLAAALVLSLAPSEPATASPSGQGPRPPYPFAYRRRPLSLLGPVTPKIAVEQGAWVPFYLLGRGRHGTWSIAGSTAAPSTPTCGEKRSNCLPLDQAGLAFSWRLHRVPIMFFAGIVMMHPALGRAVGASFAQRARPVPMVGVIMTAPDLLDVVKLFRGLPTKWGAARRRRSSRSRSTIR